MSYSDDYSSEPEQDYAHDTSELRETFFPPIRNLVHALGGLEDVLDEETGHVTRVYKLGDRVLTCLKDLKRFWRLDEKDDNRTVARIFHETNLLPNDLVPMLQVCVREQTERHKKAALACADLIMAMTWPIDVIEELKEAAMAQDKRQQAIDYSGLQAIQLSYKAAILRAKAVPDVFQILIPALQKPRLQRTQKDTNVISLILHLLRNLAAIKDKPSSATHSSEALEQSSLQSELIIQMKEGEVLAFLVLLASNADKSAFKDWNLIALDLLHLICRNVKAEELVRTVHEVRTNHLADLLTKEDRAKRAGARKGTSRHSRFGTTMAISTGDRKFILHKQSAVFESPSKVLDEVKKGKKKRGRREDELNPPTELTADAVDCLRGMALDMIEGSGFNILTRSVHKDIQGERPGVQELDSIRLLSLSAFFLDYFLHLKNSPAGKDKDWGLIAAWTDTGLLAWALKRLRNAKDEKPANWPEVHAGVNCFTQVLMTVERMAQDEDEEVSEIADVLQLQMYHSPSYLDVFVELMTGFKDQSRKYLHAVMHLTYVFLRMLEKFSKANIEMQVAKKKRNEAARKRDNRKRRHDAESNHYDDYDQMDKAEKARAQGEHTFRFDDFEARFSSEAVLSTCMAYLAQYREFDSDEEMKRVVALMHRQAIKAKSDGLFFKVSVFTLFRQILDDEKQGKLARCQANTDLITLIQYILRRFFKAAKATPLLMVRIFYPVHSHDISKMRKGKDYIAVEEEQEEHVRMPVEMDFRNEEVMSESRKLGVAIAVLQEQNLEYLLDWVKEALKIALASREEIVQATDGLQENDRQEIEDSDDPEVIRERLQGRPVSDEAKSKFEAYRVLYENDEQREAATRNSNFKLLLRTLTWIFDEDIEHDCLRWSIPVTRLPSELSADLRLIDHFLLSPLDVDIGRSAAELLKRRVKRRQRAAAANPDEEHGNLSDAENAIAGTQGKRKPRESRKKKAARASSDESESEAEAAKKRRAKRKAEAIASFKSAEFVDSDEDDNNEERDKAFFAKEQELREKREADMAAGGHALQSQMLAKKTKTGSKKRKSEAADNAPKAKKPKAKNATERSSTPALVTDDFSAASEHLKTPSDGSASVADEPVVKKPRRAIIIESED